ncbi:hypothetical protein [Psychroserpens sp. Hel_I_66]|uniref:hypothetical protein n=1 Tax=Psychroserpens sp. Hel_I_66 TaxID=1250004 RepID=UPI00064607AD|nr:hypothetical protein [Psychroserpens sp. Hel_I_66]
MNYKEAFAIDEKSYSLRKKNNEVTPECSLKNYDYYEPKLEEDFYLRYFIKEILFNVPINNLNDFIVFQYNNCKSPDDFLGVLENEVIPILYDIIENARLSMTGGQYYNQMALEDGFIETEGVIKHYEYELFHFYHLVAFHRNKNQISRRIVIVKNFFEEITAIEENKIIAPLKWIAGPAQLGYIISALVQKGYVDPPLKSNGTVNFTQLAKDVLTTFHMKDHNSVDSLRGYLNPNTYKHIEIQKHFNNHGFTLPKRSDEL